MTQAQHSAIVTLLTQKCQLIETAFIEEMTDHFVISIENRMSDSLSFQEALQQTVIDFGGRKNIQKMEWAYRKVFMKNQICDWWWLVKSQFSKSKITRSIITVGFVLVISVYFGLADFIGMGVRQALWFAFQGGSIVPVGALTWFLLQRAVPSFKKIGIIRVSSLFRTMLSYLLVLLGLAVFFIISTLQIQNYFKVLCYSTLLSALAVMYLAFLDYSKKTRSGLLNQTKIAGQ